KNSRHKSIKRYGCNNFLSVSNYSNVRTAAKGWQFIVLRCFVREKILRDTSSHSAHSAPVEPPVGTIAPRMHCSQAHHRPIPKHCPRRPSMQVIEAHGARIPTIGLGTMTLKDNVCVQAVKTALQIGYRHLDTAAFYGNETENGEGLRQSGIKREDVFICTKVRQGDLMPDAFAKVLEQSLANLKLPNVDLLLIHWNNPDIPLKLSVGALCKAKKDGKAKYIGVANFTTTMLDEAWAVTSEPLVCNQIEMHPFINQDKVLAACKKHGMAVVAY